MSVSEAISPAAITALPASTQASLPITSETSAPRAVREGSPAAKQAYATAQGFEEMLLQQLSQSLAKSSGLGGEGSAGGSGGAGEEEGGASEAGGGELEALLPQTLTEGVMRAGGIGLAAQLMNTLDPTASGQAPSGAPVTAAATPGAATNASQPVSPSGGSAAAAPASSSAASGGTSA